MNYILIILLSAVIGTTLMTIVSYCMSYTFGNQFKEPVLLNTLLRNSTWIREDSVNSAAGWLMHYTVGIGFVVIYYLLWNYAGLLPTYFNGGLLGLISGVFGICIWWIIFKIHQNPPSINRSGFFLHLIIVHIIFGVGATAGYLFFSSN